MNYLTTTLILIVLCTTAIAQKKTSLLIENTWGAPQLAAGSYRTTWTYTPQDVLEKSVIEYWTSAQTWGVTRKSHYQYRNHTILEKQLEMSLNTKTNSYDTITSKEYTYYPDGKVLTKTRSNRLNTKPEVLKDSLIYDANGHVVRIHQFSWNTTHKLWQPVQISHFEYLADGRVVKDSILSAQVVYTPFNTIINWRNNKRQFYHYNAQGVLDSTTHYTWILTMNNTDRWYRQFTEKYTYNAKGLLKEMLRLNDHHFPSRKTEYTYNPNDSVHQFIEYIPAMNTGWFPWRRGTYTYDDQLSVVENKAKDEVLLFPNPVKDHLTIQLDHEVGENYQLILYSMQGQLMIEREIVPNETLLLDRSGLHPGLYLYSIRNEGNQLTTGTLVLE